jgi:hypothetical protein
MTQACYHFAQPTAFRHFIAKTWLFLFFSIPASKSHQLLITNETSETQKSNRIQREFDSNVAIRTFDHEPSAPKNKPSQTFDLCSSVSLFLCIRLFMESQSPQSPQNPHPRLPNVRHFATYKQSPVLDKSRSPKYPKESKPQRS